MSKFKVIESSIANADSWERKGQPGWVCKCLSSALMNYLSVAVDECSDFEAGRQWLLEQNVDGVLSRYLVALTSVLSGVENGGTPESVLGGNYHHLVFAHLAWAIDRFDAADKLIQVANRAGVREISTPFWCEYSAAMNKLAKSSPYSKSGPMQCKDLESYWAIYLDLIEKMSKSESTTEALAKLDESFKKRNADKSIKDDHYEIEGSGQHPVQWDFRKETLNAFAKRQMP
ncbi:hypothetical protein [Algisphaera agarilytica]|uniref:Uncharacterized protein n=1 Tax=Algisphaera agarilytica TaxID=1385975 RepID=A0A7X0H822_9BACT|nr:hypothetical protein [Algisphaera agarilytica]MBB6429534.1 hypothetical protein [Algisphaera agarilytica]